jgi:hypothetical protein
MALDRDLQAWPDHGVEERAGFLYLDEQGCHAQTSNLVGSFVIAVAVLCTADVLLGCMLSVGYTMCYWYWGQHLAVGMSWHIVSLALIIPISQGISMGFKRREQALSEINILLGHLTVLWGAVHTWNMKSPDGPWVRLLDVFPDPAAVKHDLRALAEELLSALVTYTHMRRNGRARHSMSYYEAELKELTEDTHKQRLLVCACIARFQRLVQDLKAIGLPGGEAHRLDSYVCQVFVATHTHTHTNTHIRIYTSMYMYIIHTYTRERESTYMHACMHACIHTYIHTYIQTYIYACVCVCLCAYCMYICTHPPTHPPTHPSMRRCSWPLSACAPSKNTAPRRHSEHWPKKVCSIVKSLFQDDKEYRTPQAFRALCRVYILLLGALYGPYYLWLAKGATGTEHNLTTAIVFACSMQVAVSGLFHVMLGLEDPFERSKGRTVLDCIHVSELVNVARLRLVAIERAGTDDWRTPVTAWDIWRSR